MGSRTWIKIYCDKWLNGTIREETAELRGVWVDLLVLAGSGKYGDSGEVKITDRAGFLDQQLADLMQISVQKWVACKKKLVETDRVEVSETNVVRIKNWSKYQSEYRRQRPYRGSQPTSENGESAVTKSYNQKLQEGTGQVVTKSTARDRDRDKRIEIENRDRDTPLSPPTVSSSSSKEKELGVTTLESVLTAYQENILLDGTIPEDMEDEIKKACSIYSPTWVLDAIKEACVQNHPTWPYVAGILKQWQRYGQGAKVWKC